MAQKKALAVTSNWELYKIGRHSCILSLFHEIVHELECRLVVCGGVLSHHISAFTKKTRKKQTTLYARSISLAFIPKSLCKGQSFFNLQQVEGANESVE